jgi:hypothetical protein
MGFKQHNSAACSTISKNEKPKDAVFGWWQPTHSRQCPVFLVSGGPCIKIKIEIK